MKKSIRKIITAFLAVLTISTASATVSFAAETTTPVETGDISITAVSSGEEISPLADDIGWKYMVGSDGNLYKRRWNYTKECWYDPAWILA